MVRKNLAKKETITLEAIEEVKNLPRTTIFRSSERGKQINKREAKFPNVSTVRSWVRGLLPEAILRDKIRAGEYTALAEGEAFLQRSDEGKLMALGETMGCRKKQMEGLLPALCNQPSHDTYIEVLKFL